MVLRARRPFDSNGNSLNDTFRTFTWDADNNPVTIGPVSLTFDALDRMVEQSVSGTNSEIVYSPTGVKLALMNGATLTKAFVPLTGGATAVYTSSGLAYYRHTDHLGSSRFASTPARTLYSDTAYSPYGEPYASSGSIDNSFTGQNQDTTAGLYDFLFREQDPNQTRWTSPDPAGLTSANPAYPQSWNRYAYVSNIPMEYVDPTGLFLCGSICDPPPPPPDPGGSGGGGGGAGGSGGGGGCTFFGPGGRCGGGAGGAGSIGGGNPSTPPWCPPGDACDPSSNPKRPQPPNPPQPPQLHALSFCAAESLGFGYVPLYSVEAPPFSIASALVSIGFGVGDATGACDWVAYKLNVLVSHMKGH